MSTKKEQDRRYTANQVFGLAVSLNLLVHGLQQNIVADVINEDCRSRLTGLYSRLEACAKELARLASDICPEEGEDELRDTRVGF